MKNVSVRLETETIEQVEKEAAERGIVRAAYLRELIETRHESTEIQTEYERLQDEHERLQRKLQQLIGRQREHAELVESAESTREVERRRNERREQRRMANAVSRGGYSVTPPRQT